MRVLDFGVEPVGVVAIGANATGIIAIGQLATGVIAIGQLARGVIVVGQLALGIVSLGQLSIGVGWSSGQLGVAATSGPGIVLGLFGRLYMNRVLGKESGRPFEPALMDQGRKVAAVIVMAILAAVWWYGAGTWLTDAIVREGGIFRDPPYVYQ